MRTPRYLIYTDLDQDEELPEAYDSETRQYTFRAQPEVTRNPDHHHMFSDTQSHGRYQPVGRPSGPYPRGLAAEYSSPAPEPYQETKSGYDAGRARERTFTRAAKVIAKKAFHILIDTFRHSDPSLLATAAGTSTPTRTHRRPTNWRVDADSGELVMNDDDDDDDDDNVNGPPTSSYRIDPKRHVRWQNQQQKKTRRSAKVVGGRSRRMPVPVYGFETGGKYPSARAAGAERRRMMMDMANNRSSRSRYGGSGAFGAFGGGGGSGRARYQYPQYLL